MLMMMKFLQSLIMFKIRAHSSLYILRHTTLDHKPGQDYYENILVLYL